MALTFDALVAACNAGFWQLDDVGAGPTETREAFEALDDCLGEWYRASGYFQPSQLRGQDLCAASLGPGWHLPTEQELIRIRWQERELAEAGAPTAYLPTLVNYALVEKLGSVGVSGHLINSPPAPLTGSPLNKLYCLRSAATLPPPRPTGRQCSLTPVAAAAQGLPAADGGLPPSPAAADGGLPPSPAAADGGLPPSPAAADGGLPAPTTAAVERVPDSAVATRLEQAMEVRHAHLATLLESELPLWTLERFQNEAPVVVERVLGLSTDFAIWGRLHPETPVPISLCEPGKSRAIPRVLAALQVPYARMQEATELDRIRREDCARRPEKPSECGLSQGLPYTIGELIRRLREHPGVIADSSAECSNRGAGSNDPFLRIKLR